MTVSAWVLPSGHNNTKCETHWTRWGKLTPVPDVHQYTKCTRGRRGTHIHSQTYCKHKCQLVTGILRPRYMDGVRPHRQQRSAMSRKDNSQEKVISSRNPGRWDERAPAHTHTGTGRTVVRTLLAIRHVSVQRRSIIDLNTQRQLL